jgi:hypothetical protein
VRVPKENVKKTEASCSCIVQKLIIACTRPPNFSIHSLYNQDKVLSCSASSKNKFVSLMNSSNWCFLKISCHYCQLTTASMRSTQNPRDYQNSYQFVTTHVLLLLLIYNEGYCTCRPPTFEMIFAEKERKLPCTYFQPILIAYTEFFMDSEMAQTTCTHLQKPFLQY